MAENKGKTKGAIMSAVQSAQMAVGSALKGGQMAMGGGDSGVSAQSIPLLEDLRSIGKQNEQNTESMLSIFKAMFIFDKEQAARLRDQSRENKQEEKGPTGPSTVTDIKSLKESKGIPGVLAAAAALTALAAFARGTMFEDLIRLPGQLKGIKGMASFATGVSKIGTLGLGAKFIDNATDSLKLFKSNFITRLDELKLAAKNKFASVKFPAFTGLAKYIDDLDFVKYIKNSKGYALAVTSLKGIQSGINGIITPMKAAFNSVFGAAAAGPAGAGGAGGGALQKILAPLKAIGKVIGKLFLPITLIMGIFDGYTGFMEEYEKEQNFIDGIRGAVEGIVDGFIGGFVRLATGAVAAGLEFLGLDALATVIDDFGIDITDKFKTAVGGLVDFVTGIFTLDLERITKGLKNLVGGTADFLFTLVTTPVDAAIAFVSDIFNLGDPENPFTIRGFLFGDDKTGQKGVITKAIDFVKDLFNMDNIKAKFDELKQGALNFGLRAKAVVAASAAFVKAGFPGGESPTEAYKRVFDEVMASGQTNDKDTIEGEDLAKSSVTNVQGDTTETTYKTDTINNYGSNGDQGNITYIDNSSKQNNQSINNQNDTYTGSLSTGSDSYFDREAYGGA